MDVEGKTKRGEATRATDGAHTPDWTHPPCFTPHTDTLLSGNNQGISRRLRLWLQLWQVGRIFFVVTRKERRAAADGANFTPANVTVHPRRICTLPTHFSQICPGGGIKLVCKIVAAFPRFHMMYIHTARPFLPGGTPHTRAPPKQP